MKLIEISIQNFRGIQNLVLPLDDLTVLIGENNTGKSTVLESLKLVLTRGLGTRRGGQLSEYDFHMPNNASTPQGAAPVNIKLHFAEKQVDEWPEAVTQQLSEVVQPDIVTGLNHVWIQVSGLYNQQAENFETKWAFLNSAGAELVLRNSTPLMILQRLVPVFFLSALRDASQEFGQRGQFWSGFLKSIQLPEEDRVQLEQTLQQINNTLIAANRGLTQVAQQIGNANRLVSLDSTNPVVLEAIPTRIFDMVGKIQVHLKSPLGAKLPLHKHGEGTQSLAVLLLFQAFTATNLTESYDTDSTPILALEEPEAHLHPSAIRSLGQFLLGMTGQVVLTSHSGDLVSRVPVSSIRRLYKSGNDTKVGKIQPGQLTPRELQAIDYNIRLTRGAYLFSRCWLLVEGESDFHIMPLIGEVLGCSQDEISYSIIEISQIIAKGEPIIKFAKAMGIQWIMLADGDAAGIDYTRRAANYLDAGEVPQSRFLNLNQRDIEHEFWHNGFDGFITNFVSAREQNAIRTQSAGNLAQEIKNMITTAIACAGGKPAFAQALFAEIQQRGSASIPQSIRDVFTRIAQLSGV